ncbi:unnamed protein product [Trifolium pratense]|uniref:Uncharacterized protein n=1 Tax=Trifolium pratense TaxID=57577 RepID=A0ACB0J268_TRIPR|nr:unnamed protein product [Trifolium pratense]
MVSVSEIRKAQRAEGPATILAIGTANPPNKVDQSTYPDFYFKITNSEHKAELKQKFQRNPFIPIYQSQLTATAVAAAEAEGGRRNTVRVSKRSKKTI